ncbi:hypothetical protein D3C86_2059890 [compost metagenome]
MIFLMNSGNTIPAAKSAGRATKSPYKSVLPIFALKITAMAVGPGCGGKKPWVMESAEAIAIPR